MNLLGRVPGSTTVIYIDEVLARANRFVFSFRTRQYVSELINENIRARTRELPGNYPFVVQKTFIERIVAEWRAPARVLCKAVYGIVLDHTRRIVTEHFHHFGMGHLEQRVA